MWQSFLKLKLRLRILSSIRSAATVLGKEYEKQYRISKLNELFKPEPSQLIMGRQIFSVGTKRNWFQLGRDSGKSYGEAYCVVRYAVTTPRGYGIVVFPERGQGQKTLWDSCYLRDRIPPEFWLEGDEDKTFNKTELMVRLDNGSRIQIFGADSPDTTLRGPKPDFCNFDEYRDFRPGVYDIMEANLIGKTLNIFSTPPDTEGEYTQMAEMFRSEMKAGNKDYFYIELPTYEASSRYCKGGPKHEELMRLKRRLIQRGELSLWKREYEAKFVKGGVGAVFKKYQTNKRHIERDPSFLKEIIEGRKNRLSWWCVADPSQNGTFAVTYAVIDRTAGQLFILDETAISDNSQTGSLQMWERMKVKMGEWYRVLSRWNIVYDEAAAWFYNDLERHGVFNEGTEYQVSPTHKISDNKPEQMSFLKELFSTRNRIFISRKCSTLISEVENYVTNKKGEYHKEQKDDFIDTLRYLIVASDFEPLELTEEEVEEDIGPASLSARIEAREKRELAMTGEMDQLQSEGDDGDYEDSYLDEGEFYE